MVLVRQIVLVEAMELIPAFEALFAQLSHDPSPLKPGHLQYAIGSPDTIVYGAFDSGQLVGTGTLVIVTTLRKSIGTIQDVVVAESHRGQGLGRQIMQALLERARSSRIDYCELTSNPERAVANSLYQDLGFVLRETNAYQYRFK